MAANIAVTAALVGLVDPHKAETHSGLAAAAITKGQAVYETAAGLVDLASAAASDILQQCKGVALNAAAAGQPVTYCSDGELYGFTVSGMSVGDLVYVSDTAGALRDATGTKLNVVGCITMVNDAPTKTKVLRIQINWAHVIV